MEQHPLQPFLPENTKLLLLGSFPPPSKRWSMDFFYPNLQNDMWRIVGYIFFANKDHFLQTSKKAFDKNKIIDFLFDKGVAIFDTATQVKRLQDNASDKFLEIVTPTDISLLLKQLPTCKTVVTTGQKATDTIMTQFLISEAPKLGEKVIFHFMEKEYYFFRMPSTSRGCPKSIEQKAEAYASMFKELGLL